METALPNVRFWGLSGHCGKAQRFAANIAKLPELVQKR
jgi:hypothetical protein